MGEDLCEGRIVSPVSEEYEYGGDIPELKLMGSINIKGIKQSVFSLKEKRNSYCLNLNTGQQSPGPIPTTLRSDCIAMSKITKVLMNNSLSNHLMLNV